MLNEPGSAPPADLREPLREGGGKLKPHPDIDTGSTHLGEVLPTYRALMLADALETLPLGLLASGPSPAHPHQPVDTRTGMPQAEHLAEQDTAPPPISKQARPQPPLNIALSTRGPRTQPHTPVATGTYTWDPGPAARDPRTQLHPPRGQAPAE